MASATLGFINLTTASDKLAANELGWSVGMLLSGALVSTIGDKLIRNKMCVVAFGITLVGVSVVGLGVVHNLLAYLLIDMVNGLSSAICMGPMRTIIQTEADVIPISLVFIIGGMLTLPVGVYLFGQARRNTSVDAARNTA